MKTYPSLPHLPWNGILSGRHKLPKRIYAFNKLDGSQIRVEWDDGKWRFATRRHLMSDDDYPLCIAQDLFFEHGYYEYARKIFIDNKISKATMFFEFFGPSSFAGRHYPDVDDWFNIELFGVAEHKKGLLKPSNFIKRYGETVSCIPTAHILYEGPTNGTEWEAFVTSVHTSTLSNMTCEGVVCKSARGWRGKKYDYFKIKSQTWFNVLKYVHPLHFEELK